MPTTQQPDTDTPRCTHCQRLLFNHELDRWACRPCEDRARKRLIAMPDLYHDLGTALVPGRTGSNNGGKISGSHTAPLPVAIHPLHLRVSGGVITLLQDIEDSWRRARHSRIPEQLALTEQALANAINYLSINLTWACESYEDIADDLDTISTVYWQAKNALSGRPPRLIPVFCRLVYEDGSECGAAMRVDINRESAKCGTCGTRWGREEWVALYEDVTRNAA